MADLMTVRIVHWLAQRWCPDSELEAHPEMAMRMGELVLQFYGERSRGMAPRYGSAVRVAIKHAEGRGATDA